MAPTINPTKLPIVSGFLIGATAWILGLIVTFVLAHVLGTDPLTSYTEYALIEGTLYGYISMHSWVLDINQPGDAVFVLVPIFLLLGAGYIVVSRNRTAAGKGSEKGATVAIGYLVMAALTVIVLEGSPFPSELFIPFAWGGFIFPVVFGAIGGVISDLT